MTRGGAGLGAGLGLEGAVLEARDGHAVLVADAIEPGDNHDDHDDDSVVQVILILSPCSVCRSLFDFYFSLTSQASPMRLVNGCRSSHHPTAGGTPPPYPCCRSVCSIFSSLSSHDLNPIRATSLSNAASAVILGLNPFS